MVTYYLVSSDGGDAKRIQSPYISEKEISARDRFPERSSYLDYVPEDLVLPRRQRSGCNGPVLSIVADLVVMSPKMIDLRKLGT
jgi:hypothetical protein